MKIIYFYTVLILLLLLEYCINDRKVFSSGRNTLGQLGTGNTDDINFPKELDTTNIEDPIESMESSGDVKLLLTTTNKLYSWGNDGMVGVNLFFLSF